MVIKYEINGCDAFYLSNRCMSVIICVVNGKLQLLHCGAVIPPEDGETMLLPSNPGWGSTILYKEGDTSSSLDIQPLAWSEAGTGDYREAPLLLDIPADFEYSSFRIIEGIAAMESGLPQALGEDCHSLEITMVYKRHALKLYFTMFETAITCRTVLTAGERLAVQKQMSAMLDLRGDFDLITFNGGWIREMHSSRSKVSFTRLVSESTTGFSSNRHNPGFILCREKTTESSGEAYGFNQVYSGNHYASAQLSIQNFTRVMLGVSPVSFPRTLEAGESFESPEAVISYSAEGLNGLSRNMHLFVNCNIIPKAWQFRQRPVLYNSWEGCMFKFSESKLLSLASKAKKLGCELFVLDDGWFGERNSDTAGLGDYNVIKKKLPNGLEGLSAKLRDMGLQFGLWFEPEAVNPDSELYRAHPEWALHNLDDKDLYGRNELLLDLTLPEVRAYIADNVSKIIDAADIKYVKWDMNRHSLLSGAKAHDYILGLYDVQRRIFGARPDVLLENCASGGNRFDLGMLCFGAQLWASDNTDPIERLDIQNGLSYLYPQSCWGSHVSEAPHSQTLRNTPFTTRINTAFFGDFGLELELGHLLPVEEKELKAAIEFYKQHRETFQFGEMARLEAEEDGVCWQLKGKAEIIAGLFHRLVHSAPGYEWLKLEGIDRNKKYALTTRPQPLRVGNFGSLVKHISPVEINPNGAVLRTADRHYRMEDGAQSAECTGAALESGIPLALRFLGTGYDPNMRNQGDFSSNVYVIKEVEM